MLTIVISMAGAGSHFAASAHAYPKLRIPVHGVPMIGAVLMRC